MDKILIDSDIIIDYFYNRIPFSKDASKILNLCAIKKADGFITPLIIANVYYILRKTTKHETLISNLKRLLNYISIINMNQKIVMQALNSDFKDFEDALQNYAVENTEIKIIITRNLKDYKKSKLSVYTPESFLKTLN